MQKQTAYYQSDIGILEIVATESAICAIQFVDEMPQTQEPPSAILQKCLAQLEAYFAGRQTTFDLPLQFEGTPFQNAVWQELTQIPSGEVISYAQLAQRVGKPGAYRAVGNANGKNPISIVAACHRVIGSDGTLTGYGGGLWRKEWLLSHEGVR